MQLSPELENRLKELMRVFLIENSKLNLTALRTEDACWYGNILDSLAFLELIEKKLIPSPKSILDVGTGGGFPLLPLSLALPDVQCAGIDATGKKIEAIKRIIKEMNIKNVELITDRTEPAGQSPKYREKYHVVTARAVAPLATLLEYTVPFATATGNIVLWKSVHIDEELMHSAGAQRALHCRLIASHEYNLGGDWGTRQLLVFEKTETTSKMYPRAVGMAKKEPL